MGVGLKIEACSFPVNTWPYWHFRHEEADYLTKKVIAATRIIFFRLVSFHSIKLHIKHMATRDIKSRIYDGINYNGGNLRSAGYSLQSSSGGSCLVLAPHCLAGYLNGIGTFLSPSCSLSYLADRMNRDYLHRCMALHDDSETS
ncbi:hypothetical protein TNIN_395921 [Trichonephila inaurata madagascariensis]|uniref:Uncharacterized protein n=1 Tax=Trichonephila inaurata madagascariensis TaxID=2747483 RepID=A0A8X7C511_9ARAC|nr:hypothetical protein TNIN_395921 [Trichonephila inaurata madagascariensis]